MTSMIVLGLDPGLARLGYGVLAVERGREHCVTFGVLETAKGDLGPRLVTLHDALCGLLALHRPERVVIEQLFFSTNVKTALTVGQARGVILFTCAQAHVPIIEVSPQAVKQAVAGYGNAAKQQVQRMVQT
ncbi:crossover junction endodeoxyribonuclease RuvC, partial [Candidatus Uhrbacteria bacterium]|nr:crossover junction endodeoxyribonuclease RuvC [Candidatus Uhrbacteria bacterium]